MAGLNPALVAPRRVVVLLAAMAAALLTARQGFWQLDRAAQKTAVMERIAERGQLPVLDARALARDADAAAAQHQRRIRLQGRWLSAHTVYLDNRQMNGQPGFYVVTPLQLMPGDAAVRGDAVLVQRGWIARNQQDRSRLAPVRTPEGEVTVEGRVVPPPSALLSLGPGDGGLIRQNLDLAAYGREIGVALRPLSVQQTDVAGSPTQDQPSPLNSPDTTTGDGLLRQWPVPLADIGKHHGYAFQWFAMSALIVGLYVWFQLLRPRRHVQP